MSQNISTIPQGYAVAQMFYLQKKHQNDKRREQIVQQYKKSPIFFQQNKNNDEIMQDSFSIKYFGMKDQNIGVSSYRIQIPRRNYSEKKSQSINKNQPQSTFYYKPITPHQPLKAVMNRKHRKIEESITDELSQTNQIQLYSDYQPRAKFNKSFFMNPTHEKINQLTKQLQSINKNTRSNQKNKQIHPSEGYKASDKMSYSKIFKQMLATQPNSLEDDCPTNLSIGNTKLVENSGIAQIYLQTEASNCKILYNKQLIKRLALFGNLGRGKSAI